MIYGLAGAGGARLARHYALAQLAWLRNQGACIGDDVLAFGPFHFNGRPENLSIGDGTTINGGASLSAAGLLTIGRDVRISSHVQIQTDELVPDSVEMHREHRFAGVTIEDGVWLASGSIVVPGVRIGCRTIVAAGGVVTRDLPPRVLAGGVPARVIRPLRDSGAHHD